MDNRYNLFAQKGVRDIKGYNKAIEKEEGSGKFFVKEDGSTVLQKRGILSDREIRKIQEYIKIHYKEMYMKWAEYSKNGFYEGN